jgi:hypothetical protein
MIRRNFNWSLGAAACLSMVGLMAAAGCGKSAEDRPEARSIDARYLLREEPASASDVIAVRNDAKDQDQVVVVGRIGGRVDPWVKDSAAFSIVDRSLTPCSELPGDTCATPWDYCCEAKLPQSTLLVMLYDPDGKLVKTDARQLLGVEELDTVVIRGKAKRDAEGNVTIVASKLYVAPDKSEKQP